MPALGDEAAAKERSLAVGAAEAEAQLLQLARLDLGGPGIMEVERAIRYVRSLEPSSPAHPAVDAYLAHPLRIARLVLMATSPAATEPAVLAVLHNVYEVFGLDDAKLLRAGFPRRHAEAIRALKIDRSRERNPAYLNSFHAGIEAVGRDVSLVRVLDKLDNLLGLAILEEGEVRDSYLQLAEQFTLPMAARLSPGLGDYFAEALEYGRTRGYDPELAAAHASLTRDSTASS